MQKPLLVELLWSVTWPHWAAHRLRTVLTIVGVALGVASVVGMADVSATVLASFRHTVDTISGDSELEISNAAGKVPEEVVEASAGVPGVAAAAGVVESFIPLADRPDESLYLIGVDFLGSPVWETQFPRAAIEIEDELEFLNHADSVVLPRELLARHGWTTGTTVTVLTPEGPKTLRVRGVLGAVPAARLFDGAIAVMDLPAAQRLLGLGHAVDRVSLRLAADAPADRVAAALGERVGPGFDVAPPEARGKPVERLLFSLRAMLATMSACAVIVGTLIVFQTVAVSVQQRRREFALLNVAGVGLGTITRLCLLEIALLATIGVVAGLGGGWLLGRLGAGIVGQAVSDIYIKVDTSQHAGSHTGLVVGVVSAFGTALVAAWVAIRGSFRSTTVETLRPAGVAVHEGRVTALSLLLPVILALSSWGFALLPSGLGFVTVVATIIAFCSIGYLAGALIAPALVMTIGRVVQRVQPAATWFPVRLAIDNLPRDPARSGATVGTIIVAVAIAANVAGTVASFNTSWLGWVEHHFAADLIVGAGGRLRWFGGPVMKPEVAATLGGVPGVARVEPFRVRRIEVAGQPVFLQGIAVDDRLAHGGMQMVEGRFVDAAPGLRAGTGVVLTDNLAQRLGVHRGDALTLATPHGTRQFRVEGIYVDHLASIDLGAVGVDYDQLAGTWDDHAVNLFRIWLAPGETASAARASIERALGGGYFVLTSGQMMQSFRSLIDGFFLATWALQVVAALVGVIGVVNAQLATVLDRASEITTLRTIGVQPRDITRATVAECAALGALGGLGGIALGTMLGAEIVTIGFRLVNGLRMPFTTSLGTLAGGVVIATAVSAVAGWVPARAAARIEARGAALD
jgi:putative ABC transport system permease protein